MKKTSPLLVFLFGFIAFCSDQKGDCTEFEGKFLKPYLRSPIIAPPESAPLFHSWVVGTGEPVVANFKGPANTAIKVFIGLNEEFWKEPNRRVIDLEINGKIVAAKIDTFKNKAGTPHGYIFPTTTDSDGNLQVRVLPNPDASDKNPTVCGIILFSSETELDEQMVINNTAPESLFTLLAMRMGIALPIRFDNRGAFFVKKEYKPEPIPEFEADRIKLPNPIFDEDQDYIACYWKAWELAFTHFRQPLEGSPFVSNYIDEAFNPSLFLWDTAFMTMFCNYAYPYVPGIQSLDNFYCCQLMDGEIVREVSEAGGEPHPASRPGTADSINHPILAWAEREAYRISGDINRLQMIYEPLVRYYRACDKILDQDSGFYLGTWASMDNSPRLDSGEMLCSIDTTSEMVIFARDLAFIARELGRKTDAERFEMEADLLSQKINDKLWDPQSGFYYDWTYDETRQNVRTVAGFWPLLGEIASKEQADRLVENLLDRNEFNRVHLVPTVAASEPTFDPKGGYWRGAVWTPTTTMVVRGLERYGYDEVASYVALNHLSNVVSVFKETGTIWENYAPDSVEPGRHVNNGAIVVKDFVGWSGISPIVFLIEYAIGVKADAQSNTIRWNIQSPKRHGVENLWFGGKTVSLICDEADKTGARNIQVTTDRPFNLIVIYKGKETKYTVLSDQPLSVKIGQ